MEESEITGAEPLELEKLRRKTAFWFPVAGACVSVIFLVINFVVGRYELFVADIATLVVLGSAAILAATTDDPEPPLLISVGAILLALVTLSATQGILGYFWMYIVPILGFVAIGLRRGVVLSVVALVAMAVVLSIWTPTEVPQPIEPTIPLSFLLVAGFSAVYRYIHDRQQAQLERMSKTDQLTGLGNRRQLNDVLEREVAQIDRYGGTLAILLLDLDNFKAINDEYGHPAGDQLLVEFSDLLERNVRDTDAVIRYGGDEFVVVAPDLQNEGGEGEKADGGSGEAVAERIVGVIGDHEFQIADVSASVGVARYHHGESVETLLRRADAELYEVKREG